MDSRHLVADKPEFLSHVIKLFQMDSRHLVAERPDFLSHLM
jgi:hypothetical protein